MTLCVSWWIDSQRDRVEAVGDVGIGAEVLVVLALMGGETIYRQVSSVMLNLT